MALQFLEPSNHDLDLTGLPWDNQLAKDLERGQQYASQVVAVTNGNKGLMVYTLTFKSFIDNKSSMHSFLLEAVKYWANHPEAHPLLYAVLTKSRKCQYAIETEEEGFWIQSDKGWQQKPKKELDSGLPMKPSNPLLAYLSQPSYPPASDLSKEEFTELGSTTRRKKSN